MAEEPIVQSPSDALYRVIVHMPAPSLDQVLITIHYRRYQLLGNVWLEQGKSIVRILPEQMYLGAMDSSLIMKEWKRLLDSDVELPELSDAQLAAMKHSIRDQLQAMIDDF